MLIAEGWNNCYQPIFHCFDKSLELIIQITTNRGHTRIAINWRASVEKRRASERPVGSVGNCFGPKVQIATKRSTPTHTLSYSLAATCRLAQPLKGTPNRANIFEPFERFKSGQVISVQQTEKRWETKPRSVGSGHAERNCYWKWFIPAASTMRLTIRAFLCKGWSRKTQKANRMLNCSNKMLTFWERNWILFLLLLRRFCKRSLASDWSFFFTYLFPPGHKFNPTRSPPMQPSDMHAHQTSAHAIAPLTIKLIEYRTKRTKRSRDCRLQ